MSKVISLTEKMRTMHAAGMSIRAIAVTLDLSWERVKRTVDEEYRRQANARSSERAKERRRERGLKQPEVDWPVYDGGDVWVEDRMIKLVGVGTEDREEAKKRIERTGSPRSSRADNRCESLVEPVEASPRYIPGFLLAQDKYFAALGTPAADGLRREWMNLMGRA